MRRALWGLMALSASTLVGAERPPLALRVMTYNLHSCKGRDGQIRPDRIGEVIRAAAPDIVALQEVRVGRVDPKAVDKPARDGVGTEAPAVGEPPLPPPTVINPRHPGTTDSPPSAEEPIPFTDQPGSIARAAGMGYVFYPLVRDGRQDYGIALLCRYPIHLVRAENLPTKPGRWFAEKRGAIWAEVTVNGRAVQVLATHFGLSGAERADQVDAILGPAWTGDARFTPPFVFLGDLNSMTHQKPYKRLSERFQDAIIAGGAGSQATWPSGKPALRIDHIFIPRNARATAARVIKTDLTRVASDHLPLVAEVEFP